MTGARLLLALGLVAAAAAVTVAVERGCGTPRGPVVVTAMAEAAPAPAPVVLAPVVLAPIAVPLPDAGPAQAPPDAGTASDAGAAPLEPAAPVRLPLVALPVRRAGTAPVPADRATADAGVPGTVADAGVRASPQPLAAADAGPSAPAADAPVATAALEVFFKDELTAWLRLESVELAVDGAAPQAFKLPAGGEGKPPVLIKRMQVVAGPHRVRIRARYAGAGGIFAYMEGYKVTVVATTVVDTARGTGARVTAVAFDQGAMVAWEKRAQLRIELSAAPR